MKSQEGQKRFSPAIILLGLLIFLGGCKAYYPDPQQLKEDRDMESRFGSDRGGPRELDQSPGESASR